MSKIDVTSGLGFMSETGLGLREVFAVYGNDYPTVDETYYARLYSRGRFGESRRKCLRTIIK